MGSITPSVGLITGVPIVETVDQLMAVAARPRDLLANRNAQLQQEQLAVGKLTGLVLGLKSAIGSLGNEATFNELSVNSSNEAALTAALTGEPAPGSYQFTPVRQATTQQLLSTGFESADQALSAGSLSFRFGGFVDSSVHLDELNNGQGVDRGKIRITDRSGVSEVIDLGFALDVDDVLDAINSSTQINVTAEAVGDGFRLTDNTGQSASNLIVQEVAGGTTAADLGLASINVAATEATGDDVLALYENLRLDQLNDGNGLDITEGLDDLEFTFRDGTSLQVDLSEGEEPSTLGDVLDVLNAADPTRLQAAISADGDRIELTDLSVDNGGTFTVASYLDGTAAESLGLTTTASGDTITGGRLQAGLRTSLLKSLRGGSGFETLGLIDVTDRSGASTSIDLSSAETLQDIVATINATGDYDDDIKERLHAAMKDFKANNTW